MARIRGTTEANHFVGSWNRRAPRNSIIGAALALYCLRRSEVAGPNPRRDNYSVPVPSRPSQSLELRAGISGMIEPKVDLLSRQRLRAEPSAIVVGRGKPIIAVQHSEP